MVAGQGRLLEEQQRQTAALLAGAVWQNNALAQLLARAGRTEEALKVTQFHCRSVQSWKVGTLGAKGLYALYESHHTAPDAAPGNPRHGASGSRGPRQPRRAFAGNGTPRGRFIVECTRSVRTQEMHTYAAERN